MSPTIQISEELHQRLGKHSSGFKTPADVIAEMLDFYERNVDPRPCPSPHPPPRLEIVYYPVNDENHFKRLLLKHKFADIKLSKTDGTSEIRRWNADGFNETSSVSNNLRSGCLRGWRTNGICKAEVSINEDNLSPDEFIEPPSTIMAKRIRMNPSESTRLEIVYYPVNDENHFKRLLLKHKFADIKLSKTDGTSEIRHWNATARLNETSSVSHNLRSGCLRDWRTKGICKAELSINKDKLR